jgi:cytochrome c oxidase subunit II
MQRTVLDAHSRLRSVLGIGAPLLLILLLGGCLLPPEPKTDAGRDVFNLYIVVLILAGIVFVAVEGFILYAVFRYRRHPGDDVLPEQLHGNTLVEIIWTIIPTVIVFILFGFSLVTLGEVEARAEDPITIQVDGFQWQWRFTYEEGVSSTGAPGAPATLAVPVGEPVRLVLHSLDVNHAFFVPEFLIKRDVINFGEGRPPNEFEFTVTEEGTYAGHCAEFCGTGHAEMLFVVQAMPRADYDAYLQGLASGETPPPADGDCAETVAISANNTQFDIDEFEVPADTPFCIEFENQEAIPHNVSIYDGGEALFTGDLLNEAGTITYQVPALPAGEYTFVCDVHPLAMTGDVTVTE